MARHQITRAARLAEQAHSIAGLFARLTLIAAIAAAALAAAPVNAQQYKILKPALAPAAAQQLRGKVGSILRNATPPTAEELKTVEQFFNGYLFPAMTSDDAASLGALAKLRKDLFVQYINPAKSAEARTHLLNLTLKASGSIAAGAFHPAVRYNAALILGQLDQPSSAGAPAPLAGSTNVLTALLERDDVKGVAVPSSVKIAALVGLERHTRMGVDPQFSDRITAAALTLATRKESPADLPDDVNSWIRRLAAQVLANQFAKGLTPPVSAAFVTMVGSKEMNLDDRCGVARLLKPTMYKDVEGADAGAMADALGRLAKAIFVGERTEAEKYQEELLGDPSAGMMSDGGGRGFGGRGGGFGGRGGDFGGRGGGFDGGMTMEPQGPHFEKRRTLDRVMGLLAGVHAVADGGSDDVKQRLTKLIAPLREAADMMANDKTAELAIAESVVDLADQVDDIVNSWASNDAPPAADDGGEPAPAEGAFGEGEGA